MSINEKYLKLKVLFKQTLKRKESLEFNHK